MGWALFHAALDFAKSGRRQRDDAQSEGPQGLPEKRISTELADCMEEGRSRELASDFVTPLLKSRRLWRFRVVRAEDNLSATMVTEHGDFLMYASIDLGQQQIGFHLYPPGFFKAHPEPAFSMTYSRSGAAWSLIKEQCQNCQSSPRRNSCTGRGKQQLAFLKHWQEELGDNVFNAMEVRLPDLSRDGHLLIWCAMLGKPDLAEADEETYALRTREPLWKEKAQSLVLDFKNREVSTSAKNFQLTLPEKPKRVICQFGKLGPNEFGLDVSHPLSMAQAFAIAMSTYFWT